MLTTLLAPSSPAHRFKRTVTADALQFALLPFAAAMCCSPRKRGTDCRLGQFPLSSNKSASAHPQRAFQPNSIPAIAGLLDAQTRVSSFARGPQLGLSLNFASSLITSFPSALWALSYTSFALARSVRVAGARFGSSLRISTGSPSVGSHAAAHALEHQVCCRGVTSSSVRDELMDLPTKHTQSGSFDPGGLLCPHPSK